MTVLPVITRELQAESRHPSNHWLRMAGMAAAAFILTVFIVESRYRTLDGGQLFMAVHTTVYVMIWLLVPAMTADCIARERREGTLGLLFLTPLRSHEIVLGKSVVHMLRAATIFVAVWPIFCIPFLVGGVTWLDICTAFVFQISAIILTLSAGLLASAWGKQWTRTFLLAQCFTVLLALLYCLFLAVWMLRERLFLRMFEPDGLWKILFEIPSQLTTGHGETTWSSRFTGTGMGFTRGTSFLKSYWFWVVATSFAFSGILFSLSLWLAGRRIKGNWQESPPSARQVWWHKTFCTPQFWNSLFRRRMKQALERNPIGWLQQYSWSARLSKWGWCIAVVIVECLLLAEPGAYYNFADNQPAIAAAVCIGLAFSASTSFRRERENGALELLLVTPLREPQIIFGRLFGVWKQMLPALIIIGLAINASIWVRNRVPWEVHTIIASTVLAVPLIGLYLSLKIKQFLFAWFLTVLLGMLLPWLVTVVTMLIFDKAGMAFLVEMEVISLLFLFIQWNIALWCIRSLFRNLKQRTFVMATT